MSSDTLTSDLVENRQDALYRPVSLMAVAAAILGVCSLASLLHVAVTLVAAAAVLAAVLALRQINNDPEKPLGRKAAIAGLCLALFSGIGGWSRNIADTWIARKQVERVNQAWFDALRAGDVYRAHQLTNSADGRATILEELPELYANSDELSFAIKDFREAKYVKLMTDLGDTANVEMIKVLKEKMDSRREEFTLVYRITSPKLDAPKFIVITAARQLRERQSVGGWWLHNIFYSEDPQLKDLEFLHGLS